MHRVMKYHIQPEATTNSTLNCDRIQKVIPKGNRKRRHNPKAMKLGEEQTAEQIEMRKSSSR